MLKKTLIVLLLAGFGFAGDVENGMTAYNKQDYSTASILFQIACDIGNTIGCLNLGVKNAHSTNNKR